MALTGKKYEKFYKETGSGSDKIAAANKDYIKTVFEYSATHGFHDIMDDYRLGPIIYMMQQMQDELDYLRTEISTNKDKTGITTNQASAITANTAKTGITTKQATAITDNTTIATDNMGEIKKLDTSVSSNTNTISTLVAGKLDVVPNRTGSMKQQLTCGVEERFGIYNLNFVYEDVDKTGKTIIKKGSIQLK